MSPNLIIMNIFHITTFSINIHFSDPTTPNLHTNQPKSYQFQSMSRKNRISFNYKTQMISSKSWLTTYTNPTLIHLQVHPTPHLPPSFHGSVMHPKSHCFYLIKGGSAHNKVTYSMTQILMNGTFKKVVRSTILHIQNNLYTILFQCINLSLPIRRCVSIKNKKNQASLKKKYQVIFTALYVRFQFYQL